MGTHSHSELRNHVDQMIALTGPAFDGGCPAKFDELLWGGDQIAAQLREWRLELDESRRNGSIDSIELDVAAIESVSGEAADSGSNSYSAAIDQSATEFVFSERAVDHTSDAPTTPCRDSKHRVPNVGAAAIEVSGLGKRFGDTVVVDGIGFAVRPGSITALLGPNGAGKTTTLNMLSTLLPPDFGTAAVCGFDVAAQPAEVRRSIMLTGQFAALDEALTGRENLVLFGRLLGLSHRDAKTRARQLLESFSLTDAADRRVGLYSGGMRRRIDIACGLVTAPRVVFMDEPTTGLDPRSRQEVWALVVQMRDAGVTILLTTQYLEEADALADHIVVIDRGKVVSSGTPDELKATMGGPQCEVTPADPADLGRLRECLSVLTEGGHVADRPPGGASITIPAPDGPATLAQVIRQAEAAGIALSDLGLRKPSLDDVFLALTDPARQVGDR